MPIGYVAGLAHGHFARDGEKGGQAGRRAIGVGGENGVAVHGGARKLRQVLRRNQRLGQHAVQRVGGADALGRSLGRVVLAEQFQCIGRRAYSEEFRHS